MRHPRRSVRRLDADEVARQSLELLSNLRGRLMSRLSLTFVLLAELFQIPLPKGVNAAVRISNLNGKGILVNSHTGYRRAAPRCGAHLKVIRWDEHLRLEQRLAQVGGTSPRADVVERRAEGSPSPPDVVAISAATFGFVDASATGRVAR